MPPPITIPTTTVPHVCPRNWGFYPQTYDCYTLKPISPYIPFSHSDGSIRTAGEHEFVEAFAAGFLSGVENCFTGQNDTEMFTIGKAGYSDRNLIWQDGEPMNYAPQTECPTLTMPFNGYTPIIAVIDSHGKVCWQASNDTSFEDIPSYCKYFLCKKDGH
ncbi:hypothetical protein WR25_16749 [Diploscapter pachys]|uniref:C-type lectin domain-containing protein n=1 Tax=Diploscapter pachys TaxID=2018661 RepID=A0A2A2J5Y9_9BILA|nr:hypothetical protein WR25_16749 [Diploscapter pachys]